jgi:hypothetical protein
MSVTTNSATVSTVKTRLASARVASAPWDSR